MMPQFATNRPDDEDRKELIYERIENFFREYPDGIISFG